MSSMKWIFIGVLSITSWFPVFGQEDKYKSDFEIAYGRIPAADFEMKYYPPDTAAEAVVLAKKSITNIETDPGTSTHNFDLKIVKYFFRRIKLFKKSAFQTEGNIELSYYSKDNWNIVRHVRASVIQPDGTRYILTEGEIFKEKTTKNYTTIKFAFPKLKEGCIIEYDYELVSSNFFELPTFYFQENIPVRHAELKLSIPTYFGFAFIQKGTQKIKRDSLPDEHYALDDHIYVLKRKFFADSLPALKEEPYVSSYSDYLSQIQFQIASFHSTSNISYKNFDYSSTWQKVYYDLRTEEHFGNQFNKKGNYRELWDALKPLLLTAKTDDDKIRIVYNFLSNNIKWDGDFSMMSNESLDDAFKKKIASSGELNMMMLACLNEAEVKATPMLVSTRSHGKPLPHYTLYRQFNHVVCYIERGEKSFIVDVGDKYRPYELPRVESLNEQGWLFDEKKPVWRSIVPLPSVHTELINLKITGEGTLIGSVGTNSRGYEAVIERFEEKEKENHDIYKKQLQIMFKDIQIENVTAENVDDIEEPIKRTVDFKLPNSATTSSDLIFFNPALFIKYFSTNPFKLPKRDYPVEFPYPFKDQYILNLTLPEGYVLSEIPKPMIHNLPTNAGSFQYLSSQNGNTLQLVIKIQINQLVYQPEDYAIIKDFFNQIANKFSEQIVLKKR